METTTPLKPSTIDKLVTPASVRRYFADILTQQYKIPEAEAKELVKGWRGAEVESFDANVYCGTFGAAIGALLYKYQFPRPLDRLAYHLRAPDI